MKVIDFKKKIVSLDPSIWHKLIANMRRLEKEYFAARIKEMCEIFQTSDKVLEQLFVFSFTTEGNDFWENVVARLKTSKVEIIETPLCRCNNCYTVMIDENPQVDQPIHKADIDNVKRMEFFEDNGGYFLGCPVCETDEYLIDLEDYNPSDYQNRPQIL